MIRKICNNLVKNRNYVNLWKFVHLPQVIMYAGTGKGL